MSAASTGPGSARVSRVGDGVAPSRTFPETHRLDDLKEKFHYILRNPWDSSIAGQNEDYPWVWTQDDEHRKESSFRRDAESPSRTGISTRDACATQKCES
jgi:hypothetical protein